MKIRIAALLCAAALTLSACTAAPAVSSDNTTSSAPPSSTAQPLSPMAQDLALFCSTLESKHKNLFANISRTDWQAAVAKVEAKLPGMSDSDFYYELRHLLSLVGDSHTMLEYNDSKYSHLRGFLFGILPFSDGWRLGLVDEQHKDYLGWLVTAVGGVPIDELLQRAGSIMSFDNETWAALQFSNTINFLEALQYLDVVDENTDKVTLTVQKDAQSKPVTLDFAAVDEQQIMSASPARLTPSKAPLTAPNSYYSAELLDEKTMFIQYNVCMENPEYPMSRFANEVAQAVEDVQPGKVVIDLRYNGGGNSAILNPLVKLLEEQQKKIGFTTYTLIGGNTFSSAIINAIDTKEQLSATLVGSSTGGSVNHFGELGSFTLQNTPIIVQYSTKYFEMLPDYDGTSLQPDIPVEQSFQNYMSGVDAEVEAVLKL